MGPAGRRFDQAVAEELAELDGFSILCGRYEGVDQRIIDHAVDDVISIGDVVLAGGEIAALTVVEAVGRLVPGVLGNRDSTGDESFTDGLLEYPHYTRPSEFRGWRVPDVLTSGDHGRIAPGGELRPCVSRSNVDRTSSPAAVVSPPRRKSSSRDSETPAPQCGIIG